MSKISLTSLFAVLLSLLTPLGGASAQEIVNDSSHRVTRIRIHGAIDPATLSYLKRGIEHAHLKGRDGLQAQALIVELDTPGGLVSSVRDMAQAIDDSHVPVVVFVTPAGASATSAGALLMLASHFAVMAPGTNIGAAHPVDGQGQDIKGAMGEKVVNDTAAFARSLAELRGRPIDLAQAVVDKSKSFSAQEALEKELIQLHAESTSDLLPKLDGRQIELKGGIKMVMRTLGAEIEQIEMTLAQKVLHFLANPNVATLLMSLGMMLIYVEVSNPGITIAGALGGVCLVIAFMSYQMLPIYWGGMALLILGLILFVAEIFVTSGGALAVGGTISFILGVLWVVDQDSLQMTVSPWLWVPLSFFLLLLAGGVSWLLKRTRTQVKEARAQIAGGDEGGLHGYVGMIQADGTALFRGESWSVETSTAPGEIYNPQDPGAEPKPGDHVRVLRLKGLKAVIQITKG